MCFYRFQLFRSILLNWAREKQKRTFDILFWSLSANIKYRNARHVFCFSSQNLIQLGKSRFYRIMEKMKSLKRLIIFFRDSSLYKEEFKGSVIRHFKLFVIHHFLQDIDYHLRNLYRGLLLLYYIEKRKNLRYFIAFLILFLQATPAWRKFRDNYI